jgi:hypothetical protein
VAITDISLSAISDPALMERLKAKKQFHGIPDELLFKLAHRVTIFKIPSRWEAIYLIVENNILIPVMKPSAPSGKK